VLEPRPATGPCLQDVLRSLVRMIRARLGAVHGSAQDDVYGDVGRTSKGGEMQRLCAWSPACVEVAALTPQADGGRGQPLSRSVELEV